MALTDEVGGGIPATMLVGPTGQQTGFGGFGGDGWWVILLFLLLAGNNGWGGNGSNGLYPWMNQADITTSGFQNAALANQLSGIQSGINGLSSQICSTQMSDMERSFAAQTAQMQGMNALQSQFAQCCCDNRAGLADLKYTIATENCADRAAVGEALRDVLAANTASTQRILDQLCQDKIDAKNEEIANLRTQLNMASLAASQGAQTSRILADNAAQTVALEQYLAPVPRPAYVVQNPNCCSSGCGVNCGCGIA